MGFQKYYYWLKRRLLACRYSTYLIVDSFFILYYTALDILQTLYVNVEQCRMMLKFDLEI